MKEEIEITVELDCTKDFIFDLLEKNSFKIVEEFTINDTYLINKDIYIDGDYLELLKKCVLVRNFIVSNGEYSKLVYKYKEYNDKKEIISQGKVECGVENDLKAIKVLETIDLKELIKISNKSYVFCNDEDEFVLQYVNDKHLYIEIEDTCERLNKKYSSIEEMKDIINKYNIPIKSEDYYVKKAEIEMIERYGK